MAWSQEDTAISPGHARPQNARSDENREFFECQEFTNMHTRRSVRRRAEYRKTHLLNSMV
jgi:hypothetical protein